MIQHVYPFFNGQKKKVGTDEASAARLRNMDEETTAALLNFSYHLACGNTDEAYKSVPGRLFFGHVWMELSFQPSSQAAMFLKHGFLSWIVHATMLKISKNGMRYDEIRNWQKKLRFFD